MATLVEKEYKHWDVVADDEALQIAVRAALIVGRMLRQAYEAGPIETHLNEDRSNYTRFDGEGEKMVKKQIASYLRSAHHDSKILGEEYSPNEDLSGKDFWTIDPVDGTTNFAIGIPLFNVTISQVVQGETRVSVVHNPLGKGGGEVFYALTGTGAFRNGKKIHVSQRPFRESVISFAPLADVRKGKGYYEKEVVRAFWEFGMRDLTIDPSRFHREMQSGGLELAWVASGVLDGYGSSWTNPWDLGPGVHLVQEGGGNATNMQGLRWCPMILEAAPGSTEKKWRPNYWGVIAGNPEVWEGQMRVFQKYLPEELIINRI